MDGLSCFPWGGLNFPVVIFVWLLLGLSDSRSRALGSTRQLTAGRRIDIRIGGYGSLPLGLLLVRPTSTLLRLGLPPMLYLRNPVQERRQVGGIENRGLVWTSFR
ncbi:hypothetical protein EDB85DRAFT_1979972 [Lactarius pseudohatsudake]|nr:hypothetical protein EDB85DRAFT_1979972 [Lactarius pseudohatsudake]